MHEDYLSINMIRHISQLDQKHAWTVFFHSSVLLIYLCLVSSVCSSSTCIASDLKISLDEVEVVPEDWGTTVSHIGTCLEHIHPTYCGCLTHLLAG